MKTFIGITGTTSVGKSKVAVELAKLLKSEVISADSMQIYKGMDIGTAKITLQEMDGIKHHMIDIVEPCVNYSSYLYQQEVSKIIDRITSIPIVAGGTGFYFDSLLYPPEFGHYDENRRQELKQYANTYGIEALGVLLKNLDAETYNNVDLNNEKRVIRAIEIAESGKKKSQGNGKSNPKYNCKLFVLQRNRSDLYAQIDTRVNNMIACGLVEEVKALINKYGKAETTAFSAIGYKELIEFLQNRISLQEAVEKIKLNTRHYAKRQITYFKKMNVTQFIDVDNKTPQDIAEYIYDYFVTAADN